MAVLLLMVAIMPVLQKGGGRPAPLFRDASSETGLVFHHFTGATGEYYMPEIMGSGAALIDYDNDGDLDVYLVQCTALGGGRPAFPPPAGFKPGNRLFRNELVPAGRLRFTDVTEKAGVGYTGYGMGAAAADYDNDGDADLYLTNFGSNVLYRNNGDGTFSDVTAQSGADDARWSTSASFLDYDSDGDLDLYVCNYLDFTVRGNIRCHAPTGEVTYCGPSSYRGVPDKLLRNDGQGAFTDVTTAAGIDKAFGPGLGVVGADFNGDDRPDIFVSNDGAANLLWLNKGNGRFEEAGLISGAAYAADGVARAGMGVTAADYDNDGDEDILVTNLTREGATLFRNNSRAQFDDVSLESGLARLTVQSTGFGTSWFDYDNDGWLDLFMANGAVTLMPSLRGQPYPYHQRNHLFHNYPSMDGRIYGDAGEKGGEALRLSEVSRGAAFGDIDNDGDIDILVTNNNGPARLMLNLDPGSNHHLQVRLIGLKSNRDGLGARVALLFDDDSRRWSRAHTDGSYLNSNDPRVHFGLGSRTRVSGAGVIWPDGSRELFRDLKINSINRLRQGAGKAWEEK